MARVRRELLDAATAVATADPAMRTFVDATGPPDLRRGRSRANHFAELTRAICFQQLAGPAARTIHARFVALVGGDEPTPEAVIVLPDGDMRAAGLSGAKTASIRDLAQKVVGGEVQLDRMSRLPDAAIVQELTRVRGIGRWTAEMFLIFQLGRLDVWPVEDLGVRKGYARLHGLLDAPAARDLEPLGDPYRPYRSVAAWYCWRATDTVVPTAG